MHLVFLYYPKCPLRVCFKWRASASIVASGNERYVIYSISHKRLKPISYPIISQLELQLQQPSAVALLNLFICGFSGNDQRSICALAKTHCKFVGKASIRCRRRFRAVRCFAAAAAAAARVRCLLIRKKSIRHIIHYVGQIWSYLRYTGSEWIFFPIHTGPFFLVCDWIWCCS